MKYLDYPLHALNLWLFKFHMNQRKVGSEDLFEVWRMSSKDKLVGIGLPILNKKLLVWWYGSKVFKCKITLQTISRSDRVWPRTKLALVVGLTNLLFSSGIFTFLKFTLAQYYLMLVFLEYILQNENIY